MKDVNSNIELIKKTVEIIEVGFDNLKVVIGWLPTLRVLVPSPVVVLPP
jgi:hypothetical protein